MTTEISVMYGSEKVNQVDKKLQNRDFASFTIKYIGCATIVH